MQPEHGSNSWLIDWCAINWLTPRQKGWKLVQYKERFLVPQTRNRFWYEQWPPNHYISKNACQVITAKCKTIDTSWKFSECRLPADLATSLTPLVFEFHLCASHKVGMILIAACNIKSKSKVHVNYESTTVPFRLSVQVMHHKSFWTEHLRYLSWVTPASEHLVKQV